MRRSLLPLAFLAVPFMGKAQDLPAPSPEATLSQRIGLTDVRISYSRPSRKGRVIFGELVPYEQVWRTGANKATVLSTSSTLVVNGEKLAPGSYSVFTVPHKDTWEVIFNSNTELWGAFDRKPEEDVLRVKGVSHPCSPTETFTIGFENLKEDKADLTFTWDQTSASITLEADSKAQSIANIERAVQEPNADFRVFARSASFYLDRGLDAKRAMEWAQKSVSMDKKYWNTFTLAKAQAATGDMKNAIINGKEAVRLAQEGKDDGATKTYSAQVSEWEMKAKGK